MSPAAPTETADARDRVDGAPETQWYRLAATKVVDVLGADRERGLDEHEVERRRTVHGPNVFEATARPSRVRMILRQFADLIMIVLIVAAALAFYLGDFRGGTILLAIVVANGFIAAYQEYKAERVLDMLRALVQAQATVVRDGEQRQILERDLVPGDLVLLEEGASIPADIRLIETTGFATNDFVLTGESVPQDKDADVVIDREVPLSARDNLAFMGTTVARGNARGIVVSTGVSTEVGRIASVSESIQRDRSPLQQEIDTLATTLTKLAGLVALALFAANLLLRADDYPTLQALINGSIVFAIGVAAACVPQGLPAQISVALSLGVGRLARRHAVVKRLSAVETLGSTTVICSDKTGTITTNEMTVVHCWVAGAQIDVTGIGYQPEGELHEQGRPLSPEKLKDCRRLSEAGYLASSGRTHPPDESHHTWYAIGDPTDAAFMPLASKAGLDPAALDAAYREVAALPFDSDRKRMTRIVGRDGRVIACMKGAAESVLGTCSSILTSEGVQPLTDDLRQAVSEQVQAYGTESLRVIALALRELSHEPDEAGIEDTEKECVFMGLVAMIDLPRVGVEAAIDSVREAGVRVVMITGDDPVTAQAIAERIGMGEGRVLTGDEVASLPEDQLRKLLADPAMIFSRVSPEQKYRIVRMLKRMGDVVAVTGDGVNDTLSLKQADIGVAMGKLGSDVAKEASEIVLVDDNFSTLVAAIREGRTIFRNLKHVILSSITSNLGELGVVCMGFVGVAHGMPIPITAVQILAIDLIGEMLPLMALTFDPPEASVMKRKPRRLGEHIVSSRSLVKLFADGLVMAAAGYASFLLVLKTGGTPGMAQAATYVTIVLVQFGNILANRTATTMFSAYLVANRRLWQAIVISLAMIVMIVSVESIGRWFGFEALRPQDWIWPACGVLAFVVWTETWKLVRVLAVRRPAEDAGT